MRVVLILSSLHVAFEYSIIAERVLKTMRRVCSQIFDVNVRFCFCQVYIVSVALLFFGLLLQSSGIERRYVLQRNYATYVSLRSACALLCLNFRCRTISGKRIMSSGTSRRSSSPSALVLGTKCTAWEFDAAGSSLFSTGSLASSADQSERSTEPTRAFVIMTLFYELGFDKVRL